MYVIQNLAVLHRQQTDTRVTRSEAMNMKYTIHLGTGTLVYILLHRMYAQYSTTGTIWTEDWHKQRRQDHVEFKILDLLYVLSTLHYIFQILPMQNYIWEDLRWREQVRIFNKNVKNILFILLNILASQFPWCSSGPGKLFCWGRRSPPRVHRRSPRVPRGPESQTLVPLLLIPADRFHCYFQNNRLLFLLCDKEKQHDLTYNCTRSLEFFWHAGGKVYGIGGALDKI